MQNIKEGDRVKVAYEGTVERIMPSGRLHVRIDDGRLAIVQREYIAEVVVPPVNVGDVIGDVDGLDRLPFGAVTICRDSGEVAVKTNNGRFLTPGDGDTYAATYLDRPVEVLHLPAA